MVLVGASAVVGVDPVGVDPGVVGAAPVYRAGR